MSQYNRADVFLCQCQHCAARCQVSSFSWNNDRPRCRRCGGALAKLPASLAEGMGVGKRKRMVVKRRHRRKRP